MSSLNFELGEKADFSCPRCGEADVFVLEWDDSPKRSESFMCRNCGYSWERYEGGA